MIRRTFISLLAVCLLLGWAFSFGLDKLAGTAVTAYLRDTCLVRSSLNKVKISLLTGEAVLYGLRVDNPQGFPPAQALSIRSVRLTFTPGALFHTPLKLHEVVLEEPVVQLQGLPDEDNIDGIRRNLAAAIRVYAEQLHHTPTDPLVSVENLYSVDGALLCNATGAAPVRLPTLLMSGLGGEQGIPLSHLLVELLQNLEGAALTARAAALPQDSPAPAMGGAGGDHAAGTEKSAATSPAKKTSAQ